MKVKICLIDKNLAHPLPTYETNGSAGMDVRSARDMEILPGEVALVPCGFSIAVPPGYEAQLRPRSGLALKHGITLMNSPGTIDSDFRGEVQAIVVNHSRTPFRIDVGMRIAQMVILPIIQVEWDEVSSLDETSRGVGGFGHTGTK